MYKIIFSKTDNASKIEHEFLTVTSIEDANKYKSQLETIFNRLFVYKLKHEGFNNYKTDAESPYFRKHIGSLMELKEIQNKYTQYELEFIDKLLPYIDSKIVIKHIDINEFEEQFQKMFNSIMQDKIDIVNEEVRVMQWEYQSNLQQ